MSDKIKGTPFWEDDPDVINSEIALRRAAQKARERARRHGWEPAVFKDGKIIPARPIKSDEQVSSPS